MNRRRSPRCRRTRAPRRHGWPARLQSVRRTVGRLAGADFGAMSQPPPTSGRQGPSERQHPSRGRPGSSRLALLCGVAERAPGLQAGRSCRRARSPPSAAARRAHAVARREHVAAALAHVADRFDRRDDDPADSAMVSPSQRSIASHSWPRRLQPTRLGGGFDAVAGALETRAGAVLDRVADVGRVATRLVGGASRSSGHWRVSPSHTSSASQSPAASRQTVSPPRSASSGHAKVSPSQTSSMSHRPVAPRQDVRRSAWRRAGRIAALIFARVAALFGVDLAVAAALRDHGIGLVFVDRAVVIRIARGRRDDRRGAEHAGAMPTIIGAGSAVTTPPSLRGRRPDAAVSSRPSIAEP